MYNYTYNLQDSVNNAVQASRSMNIRGVDRYKSALLATQFKHVLDGNGIHIYIDEIPREDDYKDSLTHDYRYYLSAEYPDIYLERIGGYWMVSRHTVLRVPEMYERLYPFGLNKLIDILPQGSRIKVFELELWQIVSITLLLLISFILYRYFLYIPLSWGMRVIGYRFGQKKEIHIPYRVIHPISRSLSLFLILLVIKQFIPGLHFSGRISRFLLIGSDGMLAFALTLMLYRTVGLVTFYLERRTEQFDNKADTNYIVLIGTVLNWIVVIVGGLFVLQNLNFNVTALLAGISIGGLAIALAAQDTVKNFFGSIMIFVDPPFKPGDWIIFDNGKEGTVEKIGLRATRVRTFNDSVIYITNGKMADMVVDNMGLRNQYRFKTFLKIRLDASTSQIESYINDLKTLIEHHPHINKEHFAVSLYEIGEYCFKVYFNIYLMLENPDEELTIRQGIILQIKQLAEKNHIQFVVPTQAVVVEKGGNAYNL